jgi:hypothetical protein
MTSAEARLTESDYSALLPKFEQLLTTVDSVIKDHLENFLIAPTIEVFSRWKAAESNGAETATTYLAGARHEHIEKIEWFRAIAPVLDTVKRDRLYSEFGVVLAETIGRDVSNELESAVATLIGMTLYRTVYDKTTVLRFLLNALRSEPVPAWSDIDAFGVKVNSTIILHRDSRRIIFRQFGISDFEQEFHPAMGPSRELGFPPDSIIRVEKNTTNSWDLQLEGLKTLTLLRLMAVCSADFGAETHGTDSPFSFLGGTAIGGRRSSTRLRGGIHRLMLFADLQSHLQRYWDWAEPRLPGELYDLTNKTHSSLSIAYERYCDSLFATPVERKVATCMMGMEAIYFRTEENAELNYRLALRVSKALSKNGLDPDEIQRHVKFGYRIRSLHVHGGHLSGRERTSVEKCGLSVEELAVRLLDYLRISVFHLAFSGQDKSQFLDLIEKSLVYRQKDDELEATFKPEREFIKLPEP